MPQHRGCCAGLHAGRQQRRHDGPVRHAALLVHRPGVEARVMQIAGSAAECSLRLASALDCPFRRISLRDKVELLCSITIAVAAFASVYTGPGQSCTRIVRLGDRRSMHVTSCQTSTTRQMLRLLSSHHSCKPCQCSQLTRYCWTLHKITQEAPSAATYTPLLLEGLELN